MYCTLSSTVCTSNLPTEQATSVVTVLSWGYDSYTHAYKARPLTTVGRTSLSVVIIIIMCFRSAVWNYQWSCCSPTTSGEMAESKRGRWMVHVALVLTCRANCVAGQFIACGKVIQSSIHLDIAHKRTRRQVLSKRHGRDKRRLPSRVKQSAMKVRSRWSTSEKERMESRLITWSK